MIARPVVETKVNSRQNQVCSGEPFLQPSEMIPEKKLLQG